ncbi:MAG: polysaccharide pyruvyl transferase family protein [Clostridium sp.]|nr:polysaccharide pyruvyl transferase family protein [Clostridium sp.]
MKTVGIITFHCSYNYGSALQAYALQTYVESLGYRVKIIDFRLSVDFENYKLFRTKFYKKHLHSLAADILFFIPHLKRKNAFERFSRNKLHLTAQRYNDCKKMRELNREIDIFICGSDQIWNLDCTHGIEEAFFLKFADNDKIKIAYAPSLTHTVFQSENEDKPTMKKLIDRLDALSVREESALPYLQSLTDREITVTLDPVLLLNVDIYRMLRRRVSHKKKYIFVYMLDNSPELIEYCRELKKKTGYELRFVSYKVNCGIREGKNMFGISPERFLGYIDSAEYVITNSFHATVFSILFHKKFCVFKTAKSFSRIEDLLNNLGLQASIYGADFDIDKELCYQEAMVKLEMLKSRSMNFLKEALDGKDRHENGM